MVDSRATTAFPSDKASETTGDILTIPSPYTYDQITNILTSNQ